jgi:hypothetical protein
LWKQAPNKHQEKENITKGNKPLIITKRKQKLLQAKYTDHQHSEQPEGRQTRVNKLRALSFFFFLSNVRSI